MDREGEGDLFGCPGGNGDRLAFTGLPSDHLGRYAVGPGLRHQKEEPALPVGEGTSQHATAPVQQGHEGAGDGLAGFGRGDADEEGLGGGSGRERKGR